MAAFRQYGEKGIDDRGVELATPVPFEFLDSFRRRHRGPVRSVGRHRVEGVRYHKDAGSYGYILTGQPIGIARPVEVLMVMKDRGGNMTNDGHAAEYVDRRRRVPLHFAPLLFVERTRLEEEPVGYG